MSHTATGEWKSFEMKMRRRRAERLVLRADVAADAGCRDEARVLIDEARTLWPAAPGLAELQQKIGAAEIASKETVTEEIVAPSRWKEITAAVAAILFVASAAYVVVLAERHAIARAPEAGATAGSPLASANSPVVNDPVPAARAPVTTPAADATPPATEPAVTESPVTESPPIESRASESPVRSVAAPSPDITRATEPATRGAQSVEPARKPAPNPVGTSSRATPPPSDAIRLDPGTPEFAPPAPVSVPVAPAPLPPPPLAAASSPVVPVPSNTAPIQPPPEALVRGTLARYAKAYDDLDVDAAERVWPSVNRSALSRAFDSLAAQHVSLGDCRIQIDGDGTGARATCLGSATWTPRVGGRDHTDGRSWSFDLAKSAAGWVIVNARVQNR